MACWEFSVVTVILALAMSAALSADRIKLRSGKIVDGTFVGADSKTVRFLLANGTRSDFAIGDVEGVDSRRESRRHRRRIPPRHRARAGARRGSMLNVRLAQAIDVDASQAGMTFKGIVDDPVMLSGSVVIPRGAGAVLQAVQVQTIGKDQREATRSR